MTVRRVTERENARAEDDDDAGNVLLEREGEGNGRKMLRRGGRRVVRLMKTSRMDNSFMRMAMSSFQGNH